MIIRRIKEEYWKSDRSTRILRRFGFGVGSALLLIAIVEAWRHWILGLVLSLAGVGLAVIGEISPRLLGRLHRLWFGVRVLSGVIFSAVFLLATYYLVVTPIGVLQRVLKQNRLDIGFKSDQESYWQLRSKSSVQANYERQF